MPPEWYDMHAVNKMEDTEKREFYRRIIADKKPYFMRYIYPSLMRAYKTYADKADRNALREFNMTVEELELIPKSERSSEQNEFLRYYEEMMPVGTGDCVMNKICRRFEDEFDGCLKSLRTDEPFDYTFMKSELEYSHSHYREIKELYEAYNKKMQIFAVESSRKRIDKETKIAQMTMITQKFREECEEVCPNAESLCNIVLDLCYGGSRTKRFAWMMCGSGIIHNLLSRNDGVISFPAEDEMGDITYCGMKFSERSKKLEVSDL